MSFPKLEVPVLKCILPVSQEEIKYRPYTVKEDKILNLVMTEKDEAKLAQDIMDSVIALTEACTYGQDIASYPMADVEFLFLQIKAASTGNTTKKIYECQLTNDAGEKCGADNVVEIDINEIKLSGELPNKIVKLNDELSLSMKVPSFKELRAALNNSKDTSDIAINTMAAAVDMVLSGEDTYNDFEMDDLIDNILINLTGKQIDGLKEYFEGIPLLLFKKEFVCKKCKSVHQLEVKHLLNFFD